eukprot:TRINITY_DN8994_c0_g1_i3.p1 TRINITY_DN8994_c0_g1~~TRINITY_DN8994_c0_g1_i3.p1  ORF type:complete len:598 (+),score=89.21 TRINITY_DN8994_c0_g1_i3:166-1794(+)
MARNCTMPCSLRGLLWYRLSGGEAVHLANPKGYSQAFQAEFGRSPSSAADTEINPDDRFTFGCLASPSRLALTQAGLNTLEHVLLCLRYEHSEALYCPFLPILVASCLHWMSPEHTFATAMALLEEPSPLPKTRLDTWSMIAAFDSLATTHCSKPYAQLFSELDQALPAVLTQQHPLRGVALDWVSRCFPFWSLMRFLDNFTIEGDKTFYRVGLAVLHAWGQTRKIPAARTLRKRPKPYLSLVETQAMARAVKQSGNSAGGHDGDQKEIDNVAASLISKTGQGLPSPTTVAMLVEDADTLIELAFTFNFKRAHVRRAQRRAHVAAQQALYMDGRALAVGETGPARDRRRGETYGRLAMKKAPSVIGASRIADLDLWKVIWRDVPIRFHLKQLKQLFTTDSDGYNLASLYNKSQRDSPTILLVKTAGGQAFGAFLTAAWDMRHSEAGYFGTGESFVFTKEPLQTYRWSGLDGEEDKGSLFMHGSSESLLVGGSSHGHAIRLDRTLSKGASHVSDTYNSPQLAGDKDGQFDVVTVEVYGFVEAH